MIISKNNTTSYTWGAECVAWHLVNTKTLSVIQETMPPKAEEQLHFHLKTQQFFYILKGEAEFTIGDKKTIVPAGTGVQIQKGQAHKVKNATNKPLELLVISQPHSHLDRINIKQSSE